MTAPVLMVQGTASSVGKSMIAAGLCRILRRRGVNVAPFKAQNMSLNAAVTADGGEIARSIAVQAAAAGVEPTVDMNPILLKPEAESRSQVIVRGRVWSTMEARAYLAGGLDLWPIVADSLDRLRKAYQVVVAEGAGSPAELNLRDRDLVNMRVARQTEAAVLLVGDVDRGGVFAQLIGTLDLLKPEERALVRGLVVNRFRGDPTLFEDGVRILEERTGLPVLGVVPMVRDIGLAEEDSVPLDNRQFPETSGEHVLRIAVARLPHIANFDDFDPLAREAGVALGYAARPEQLHGADLVIVPGSKSTIADLAWLHDCGIAKVLRGLPPRGTPVMGICGGLQMLGRAIHDPDGVESAVVTAPGLDLLPIETLFAAPKRTARVRGCLDCDRGPFAAGVGHEVDGYEIHAGRTRVLDPADSRPILRLTARLGQVVDEPDGAVSGDGLVCGTYLHGLFENEIVRQTLLAWLAARRGWSWPPDGIAGQMDDPHDRWADALEAAFDVPRILQLCHISPLSTPRP
jgi:adenosylcobyric acid synthase